LIHSARRQKALAVGKTRVEKLVSEREPPLVVVARDARAALDSTAIQRVIVAGHAVAWADRRRLGALVGREEAAVVAVLDDGLANALKATIAMANLGPPQEKRDKRVISTEAG
jgi:ribosomal protein L7Ae-like RNA K-turn-binding protein